MPRVQLPAARGISPPSVQRGRPNTHRFDAFVALALGAFTSWLGACGTDAVGESECRQIEQARCEAAAACGFPAVAECQRFFRDHCLHGLPVAEVDIVAADACAADMRAAGACAAAQGGDTAPGACDAPIATDGSTGSVCDLVRRPESSAACAFLRPSTAPAAAADGGTP